MLMTSLGDVVPSPLNEHRIFLKVHPMEEFKC